MAWDRTRIHRAAPFDVPGGDQYRVVPRGDRADHAEWLAMHFNEQLLVVLDHFDRWAECGSGAHPADGGADFAQGAAARLALFGGEQHG